MQENKRSGLKEGIMTRKRRKKELILGEKRLCAGLNFMRS